jgi:hypothetical protein
MRDRHHPRLCGSCRAPMARTEDACWRCESPWVEKHARAAPSATHTHPRPHHGGRRHQAHADAGIAARREHAAAVRRRAAPATRAERALSRAARATTSVLHRSAPDVVWEGSSESTPLFTRHTRGAIEAERDRRRQRRAGGAVACRGATRKRAGSAPHPRITAAVAGSVRAVAEARLDMDRWIDEGGTLPSEAAAAYPGARASAFGNVRVPGQ